MMCPHMKTKKITLADRKRMAGIVAKLKPEERDELMADLVLFAERAIPVLDELIKNSTLTTKEKREIEDSISVGPQWLRYSRRVKRSK